MARYEPTLLLSWTMLTAAAVFGDLTGPVRMILALVFLGIVPGLAFTRLAHIRDLELRLLTAIPVSLAVDAIVAGVLVYGGIASWDLGLSIIISLSVAATIFDLTRPDLGIPTPDLQVSGKLDDEVRQARLVDALTAGGSLAEAAAAAGVSRSTLYRALRRSAPLRRAVEVASRGTVNPDLVVADKGEISSPDDAAEPT